MSQSSQLKHIANEIAEIWDESEFYDDAEQYTYLFWREDTLYRAFFDLLDTTNLIELSCGHGRHSEKAQTMAGHLTLVDVLENNLDFCRERLRGHDNVSYVLGDGYTFTGIGDASQTAIFSYGSMVHFPAPLVESYLKDAARVLEPGGMALFHHSNLNVTSDYAKSLDDKRGRLHMTRGLFNEYAAQAGLEVVEAVEFDWAGLELLDGLTLVKRPG